MCSASVYCGFSSDSSDFLVPQMSARSTRKRKIKRSRENTRSRTMSWASRTRGTLSQKRTRWMTWMYDSGHVAKRSNPRAFQSALRSHSSQGHAPDFASSYPLEVTLRQWVLLCWQSPDFQLAISIDSILLCRETNLVRRSEAAGLRWGRPANEPLQGQWLIEWMRPFKKKNNKTKGSSIPYRQQNAGIDVLSLTTSAQPKN